MANADYYYELGHGDGLRGNGRYLSGVTQEQSEAYNAGLADGQGERELAGRAVDEDYADWVPAPAGFEYTGEKRVAQPGEWYLTKNGNASQQKGIRRNAQTRHILRREGR